MIMLHEPLEGFRNLSGRNVSRKLRDAPSYQFWDEFYQQHRRSFFKDRHYLSREFPLLLGANLTVMELGCGVGNAGLPLSEENSSAFLYCCDYSAVAIDLLKADSRYNPKRMKAFVADITKQGSLSKEIPVGSVDVATAIFALSANSPASLYEAALELKAVLKPETGTALVRDYAAGDLAEERLESQGQHRNLSEHMYSRGDGTWCLFFTEDTLCSPFLEAGLICRDVHIRTRTVVNRKTRVKMARRFIQATFCLPPGPPEEFLRPQAAAHSTSPCSTDDEDVTAVSSHTEACTGPLQCLQLAAATTSWSEDLEFSNTERHKEVNINSERQLAEWFCQMPFVLRNRIVVDMGSGSSGICVIPALASCTQYIMAAPSMESMQSVQENLRPQSHKFVCERLRLATIDTLLASARATKLFRELPVVLVIRVDSAGFAVPETAVDMQARASAELLQGSILVYVGNRLDALLGVDAPTKPKPPGCKWELLHTSTNLRVLQLSA